ncbi:MAG: hypothetical protein ABF969_04055 [Sporolactobacillus sp.]
MNLDRFKGPQPMSKPELIEAIENLQYEREHAQEKLYEIDDRIEELRSELIS